MDSYIKYVKIDQAVHFKYGQIMCANYNSIKLFPQAALKKIFLEEKFLNS